jgi:hypothetical protein
MPCAASRTLKSYLRSILTHKQTIRISDPLANVRTGSKADVTLLNFDVCFTPESGHAEESLSMIEWPARCLLHIRGAHASRMGLARSQLDNVGRRCRCGKRLQFVPSIYDLWGFGGR